MPEPSPSPRRRRATPSVSFSEPVTEAPRRDEPRRSKNRLEARLAELQRDVASLSQRLRATSTASQRSLDEPSELRELRAKSPARTILKKSRASGLDALEDVENRPPRLENARERDHESKPPKSAREMLRLVRELRVVAVERDQLRFEIDQTRRSLVAMEKKAQEAAKWKEAYDKMKAHCDSLQESLELSEKIRVRQKRLLQQLQQTVKDEDAVAVAAPKRSRAQRVDVLDSVFLHESPRRPSQRTARVNDSVLGTSRMPSTRPSTRISAPRQASAAVNTSTRSFNRSDFDSMLQLPLAERSLAGSTMRRTTTTTTTQPRREATRTTPSTATRTARSKPPPAPQTTSTTATSRAARAAPATRTNHFLAPTQSSLNHAAKRRPEATRTPFLV